MPKALQIHIAANKQWGGAETRALIAARQSPLAAVVVTAATDAAAVQRFRSAGIFTYRAKVSGMFAAITLSRIFRNAVSNENQPLELHLHSPQIEDKVKMALKLTGQQATVLTLPNVEFPAVTLNRDAEPHQQPTLIWCGRITATCGLGELLEALAAEELNGWRLKVVGEGEARTVSPLLHRTRALGISQRIDWRGWSDDVYAEMTEADCAVVTRTDAEQRTVYKEFQAAGVPTICATDRQTLKSLITEQHPL
jgi:glycosyltransferase involved in cell wall biosynthesis